MQQNKDTPSIRFAGFTDAWEQREFGNIVSEYTDPVTTPTNGYSRLGIKSHAKGTFHSYVRPGMELGTGQMHRVAANNFIVNITFGWEHAVAITTDEDAGKLVSHRFPQFSFSDGMAPMFFKYLILDEDFRHHLWLASPGGAGRNRVLKISEMLEYKFCFPSKEEQEKIAIFLTKLDRLITLHQRKYDQLVNIKKSMLDKMFPKNGESVPGVRFAGFTGAWERRKIREIAEIVGGGTPSTSHPTYWDGDIDWYTPAEMEGQRYAVGSVRKITEPGLRNSSARVLPANRTVLFTSRAGIGKMAILKRQGATNQGFQSMVLTDACNPYFIYSMGAIIKEKAGGVASGSTFLEISGKMLGNMEIAVPSKPEQDAIAEYFERIDDLITLHQRKLERLQNIKKACLEKMFV